MTVAEDVYIRKLENKYDQLERDYLMIQRTLAFILWSIGEPVTLTDKAVREGLPEGAEIFIRQDPTTHDHVFGIEIVNDDTDA